MADTAKALGAGITIDPAQISRPSCGTGTVYDLASGQCVALASANLGVGSCDAALTLVGGKTAKACCDAGGNVVSGTSGEFVCKFSQSSCPAGWGAYKNWSTTSTTTCNTIQYSCGFGDCSPTTVCSSCTVAAHAFKNIDINTDTCSYAQQESHNWGSGNYAASCLALTRFCYPDVIERGCQ